MGRAFDWDRYEEELDDGISIDAPKFDPIEFDPVVAIFWSVALVIGLAFATTVTVIGWRLVTWMI